MDELTGRPNSSLFLAVPAEEWPWSLQECLQAYITSSYPNLHLAVMLMLFALLPLSSVSYQRSTSALHNFHTSQRCKTLQRLSSLALIDVHNTHRVGVDSVHVCETYMYMTCQRRLDVGSLLASLLASYEQIPTESLLLYMCLSSTVALLCVFTIEV